MSVVIDGTLGINTIQDNTVSPSKTTGLLDVIQIVTSQVGTVATGTTIIPFDNTIPQITEGTEFMTVTITPTSASSTLEIDVTTYSSHSVGNFNASALFQDSTANALAVGAGYSSVATGMVPVRFTHYMTAGTTSPTTFRVRIGNSGAGTLTFNGTGGVQTFGGVFASRITVKEYRA